jgi:hypothetical protein
MEPVNDGAIKTFSRTLRKGLFILCALAGIASLLLLMVVKANGWLAPLSILLVLLLIPLLFLCLYTLGLIFFMHTAVRKNPSLFSIRIQHYHWDSSSLRGVKKVIDQLVAALGGTFFLVIAINEFWNFARYTHIIDFFTGIGSLVLGVLLWWSFTLQVKTALLKKREPHGD